MGALLLVLDYLWLPYPLREVPEPRWVKEIGATPPSTALLNVPGGHRARAAEDMFLQTYHGLPLIGGYVSCTPPAAEELIAEFPFLRTIFEGRPKQEVPARQGLRRILEEQCRFSIREPLHVHPGLRPVAQSCVTSGV